MSLIVSIINKEGSNLDTDLLEDQQRRPHNHIFGFESWSSSVWGHKIMKALGCEMIYSLRRHPVYAFDDEIQILKHELNTILTHIDLVAKQTKENQTSIEIRVKNALEMIRIAEEHIDYVGIMLW